MPLKDLLAKAPSPLPPSEEPWPRSEGASLSLRNKFRQSPLYSATARPTLDEFLRTNYLMIPDFLLQVNNAKVAARTGRNVQDVQNTAAGHRGVKLAVNQGLGISSTSDVSSSSIARSNDKDLKMAETREMKERDPKPSSEVQGTKSGDKLFAMSSQKRSYQQIQVPPPLRPKPRVKKVMKGGTLVTIPAPQPRKRAKEEPTEDGGKSIQSGVDLINSEDVEDAAAVSEMSVEADADIKKNCDRQQLAKEDDSSVVCQDESDLQSGISGKESKGSEGEILTEECEQRQASLTFCSTDASKESKKTTAETTNSSLSESYSSVCTSVVTNADESIAFLSKEPETNKGTGSLYNEDVQRESINVSKSDHSGKTPTEKESELIDKEPKLSDNFGEAPHIGIPPIADPKEVEISKVPTEETVKGPGSQVTVCVVPEVEATDSCKMEKLPDLSSDLAVKSSIVKQSSVDDNKSQSGEEPNQDIKSKSYSRDSHATDKGDSHIKTTDHRVREANYRRDRKKSHGNNTHDLKDADLENFNADTVHDVDENSNSENCSCNDDGNDGSDDHKEECEKEEEAMEEEKETEEEGDDDDDDDEDDDDSNCDDDDDDDVSTKDNLADDSNEEYAELVMDDSTSEEEEEYDFHPVNKNNSDEDEDEESDYEVEDMNLDSDTESSTGGITFYQDTTIGKRVKRSRNKQREKRKAKNQRKKASKKRAKAAKQAAQAHNKIHDSTARKKSLNNKQKPDPALKKKGAKVESRKQGSTSEHKPETVADTVSKPKPADKKPSQSNPPQKRKSEEGSLLSMVSSCAVDPTVAASEKLFVKKRRGGQHAKKKKKEKRKVEALERIRRGEPPPRPRRTFVELPKPICSFYREGKCRKGSDCSFRHDKSALIKKKEVCKFYLVSADTCYAGDDCIFMHNSFPCKFFHTSRCWEGDHCRFSHDALTEETKRLLQACLKPPIEDSVQAPQDKNLTASNQQTADYNTCSEDTAQTATSSSPYNFRASTRKRALSTDGTDGGSVIGGKISRRESQGKEEEDSTKSDEARQSGSFLPGLYRDLST